MHKKRPFIQLLAKQIKQNRELVLAYTAFTEADYMELYTELAELLLMQQLPGDAHGINEVKTKLNFWPWWTRHYNRVDMEWLDSLRFVVQDNRVLYKAMPNSQIRQSTSSELVLAESYRAWHKSHVTDNRNAIKHSFNNLLIAK